MNLLFKYATSGTQREKTFLQIAVRSVLKYFPDAHLRILYNGNEFNEFKKSMNSLFPNISFRNQRESNYQFDFEIKRTWWKWCNIYEPDFLGPQITIDTDIIFLKNPTFINTWLNDNEDILAVGDTYINKRTSCGSFGKLVKNHSLINSGIIGIKHNIPQLQFSLQKIANQGWKQKQSIYDPQDEQGAFNAALYMLVDRGCLSVKIIDHKKICIWPYYTNEDETAIHFIGYQKVILEKYYDEFKKLILDHGFTQDDARWLQQRCQQMR